MTVTRRDVLAAGAALAILPMAARAATTLDYTPGLIDARLAAGETLFVEFGADWCSTCRAQERVIGALRAANPAYDQAMTFIRVDWDEYRRAEIVGRYNVPRRSTLIVLRNNSELGRIVAGTRQRDIEALMNLGLA